jgi:hypothetical protein
LRQLIALIRRTSLKIFTTPDDVERLEQRVRDLPINARVRIVTYEGNSIEGLVSVTPTVQTFRDDKGDEGLNGTVKLEDPHGGTWSDNIWLGDIDTIEHLDSVTIDSTRA